MKNVLIIGATSGIGRELCIQYSQLGYKVTATGRRREMLVSLQAGVPNIFIFEQDITVLNATEIIEKSAVAMDGIDLIIISAGYGDINLELKQEIELNTVKTNVLGFTDCAAAAYKYFKKRGGGTLAGISSIASFRGGAAGPSYSASKAYVSNYLEGIRLMTWRDKTAVTVSTIIPGFMDTALAKGVGGAGIFWLTPVKKAAAQIIEGLDDRKEIIYITKRWCLIALALKCMPWFAYRTMTGKI